MLVTNYSMGPPDDPDRRFEDFKNYSFLEGKALLFHMPGAGEWPEWRGPG